MYGVVKDTVGYYRTAGILNVQDLNDGTHLQHVPAHYQHCHPHICNFIGAMINYIPHCQGQPCKFELGVRGTNFPVEKMDGLSDYIP